MAKLNSEEPLRWNSDFVFVKHLFITTEKGHYCFKNMDTIIISFLEFFDEQSILKTAFILKCNITNLFTVSFD